MRNTLLHLLDTVITLEDIIKCAFKNTSLCCNLHLHGILLKDNTRKSKLFGNVPLYTFKVIQEK